jgi:hypothetical protein
MKSARPGPAPRVAGLTRGSSSRSLLRLRRILAGKELPTCAWTRETHSVASQDLRTVISGLVAGVRPLDEREVADQAGILKWIASGDPLFRIVPPATPPQQGGR